MEKKPIILGIIRLAFLALWASVAVEKLWDLAGFHSTLRRQPIPEWSTDILFWLLPLAELGAAVLLAWPRNRKRTHHGMWLSAVLMLAFTLFIGFGVLGWYEKRPCGCGSVISGLSWDNHLWFNFAFFLLAALGVWLTWPKRTSASPMHGNSQSLRTRAVNHNSGVKQSNSNAYRRQISFPRKFALFRRRALSKRNPACTQYLIRASLGQARRHVTGISTSVTGLR